VTKPAVNPIPRLKEKIINVIIANTDITSVKSSKFRFLIGEIINIPAIISGLKFVLFDSN